MKSLMLLFDENRKWASKIKEDIPKVIVCIGKTVKNMSGK
jgi:hypothetical protein